MLGEACLPCLPEFPVDRVNGMDPCSTDASATRRNPSQTGGYSAVMDLGSSDASPHLAFVHSCIRGSPLRACA
jgi:hypothetical protein